MPLEPVVTGKYETIRIKVQDIVDLPFDSRTFALQLIEAYSAPKATLAKRGQVTLNKAEREGDLLWSKKMHCRITSLGKASEELDALRESWSAKKNAPRFLLAPDGVELAAIDTRRDDLLSLAFSRCRENETENALRLSPECTCQASRPSPTG